MCVMVTPIHVCHGHPNTRVSWSVTPNFVLPGNGPADLIRLPEMVGRRTKSSCLKWSAGPFQAALNGPTMPVLVRWTDHFRQPVFVRDKSTK